MKLAIVFLFQFILISLPAQLWQQISDFPATERDDGCCFTIQDKAYCGTGLQTGFITSADFYSLNMNNDMWSAIASLPSGNERQYASAFSNDTNGFVFSGKNGSIYLNDLLQYDTLTNNWTNKTSLPSLGRMGCSSFVIGNIAYVVGGRTSVNAAINEVWAYNMDTDNWTQKNNFPFGSRWRGTATALNNKGYLLFGADEFGAYRRELYEYDVATDSWTYLSTFPSQGRTYSSMKSIAGDLVVICGYDSLFTSYNDMFRINPANLVWQQLASIPSLGRRGGMCFNNTNSIYYSCGIDQSNTRLKETWKVSNPTSIGENVDSKINLTVFPNPFDNEVNISYQLNKMSATAEYIEITDVLGRVMQSYIIKDKKGLLSIHPFLEDGIYFVNLKNNKEIKKTTLIKMSK